MSLPKWKRSLRRLRNLLTTRSSWMTWGFVLRLRLSGGAGMQTVPQPAGPQPVSGNSALPTDARAATGAGGIPPIVFQTWKSKTELPPHYAVWSPSFPRHNPQFRHVIWDDADNRAFIRTSYPWFLDIYDRYPAEIFRADIVRYFFMFHHGGLYADMDTECLAPLDGWLQGQGDVVLGAMGGDVSFPHSIPNAMMASRPGQLFWLLVIALAVREAGGRSSAELKQLGPEAVTGPILLRTACLLYRQGGEADVRRLVREALPGLAPADTAQHGAITLLDREVWYPLDWTNKAHKLFLRELRERRLFLGQEETRRLFPRARLITYWGHSW